MGKLIYNLELMNSLYAKLRTKEQQISFLMGFEQKQTSEGIVYFVKKEGQVKDGTDSEDEV